MSKALDGCAILVVEDESLVAMLLETILEDMGCATVGPAATVEEAMDIVEGGETPFRAALLDVNVAGQQVFPVAEALLTRRIPFVFSTGYGQGGLPDRWRDQPVIQKPFTEDAVQQALMKALNIATA